jgi:hypothetical protein
MSFNMAAFFPLLAAIARGRVSGARISQRDNAIDRAEGWEIHFFAATQTPHLSPA